MTEILLIVFVLLCMANVGLMTFLGWKKENAERDYYFLNWYSRYPSKTVTISGVLVGIMLLLAVGFGRSTWAKIVLSGGDLVFAAFLYLDYAKKFFKRWIP